MIYLASPYSHRSRKIREQRFNAVCKEAAGIMRTGLLVFSPIAHGHAIAEVAALPTDWGYWKRFSIEMIRQCSEFWVLELDGWDKSEGVMEELRYAQRIRKEVRIVEPGSHR